MTPIASIERHMRHTYILVLHSPPKNTTTSLLFSLIVLSPTMHTLRLLLLPKIQQTKMLVMCQRFGDLFLFGLIWQYSSNHKTYNKGRFKVIATYLQQ